MRDKGLRGVVGCTTLPMNRTIVMWVRFVGRLNKNLGTRPGVYVGTAAVLCGAVAPIMQTTPAHAAWPGKNGLIAYSSYQFPQPPWDTDIYTMMPDGSNKTRLTFGPEDEHSPAWSPDGKKILYTLDENAQSSKLGPAQIWEMNADGSNQHAVVTDHPRASDASYSPDGQSIVYSAGTADTDVAGRNTREIYTRKLDGSGLTQLTFNSLWDEKPKFSPDGTKIAYVTGNIVNADRFGTLGDTNVMNADGTGRVQLTELSNLESGGAADWTSDGSRIIHTIYSQALGYGIASVKPDGSDRTIIVSGTTYYYKNPTVSPDNSLILFDQEATEGGDIYQISAAGGAVTDLSPPTPPYEFLTAWQAIPQPAEAPAVAPVSPASDSGSPTKLANTGGDRSVFLGLTAALFLFGSFIIIRLLRGRRKYKGV